MHPGPWYAYLKQPFARPFHPSLRHHFYSFDAPDREEAERRMLREAQRKFGLSDADVEAFSGDRGRLDTTFDLEFRSQ